MPPYTHTHKIKKLQNIIKKIRFFFHYTTDKTLKFSIYSFGLANKSFAYTSLIKSWFNRQTIELVGYPLDEL